MADVLKHVQALISMQAWGSLTSVQRIEPDTLSLLSSAISSVHQAITSRSSSVVISNVEISLTHLPREHNVNAVPFALFLMVPSSEGLGPTSSRAFTPLAGFLRESTRQIALRQADIGILLEAAMRYESAAL